MWAMQLDRPGESLHPVERAIPLPGRNEMLIEVSACGVCRTDLHVVDGDITGKLPIVPGHEIVGRVIGLGENAGAFGLGDRVGVPLLGHTCGQCPYSLAGAEKDRKSVV